MDEILRSMAIPIVKEPFKERTVKPEILERRKKMYTLILRGETQERIAAQFNITSRHVRREVIEIRKELSKDWDKQSLIGKMYDYDEKAAIRVRKLHTILLDQKSPNDEVIKAIKELRSEDESAIKREQLAGILPKEASPLVSISSESKDGGDAENKVIINIIAPKDDPVIGNEKPEP